MLISTIFLLLLTTVKSLTMIAFSYIQNLNLKSNLKFWFYLYLQS